MHRPVLPSVADPIAPPDSPLDDLLLRLLSVTPTGSIHAYTGTAEVAAWSSDGRYLAAGYSSGRLLLWDSARQGRVALRVWPGRQGAVSALAWSPDGRLLASAGRVALWRVRSNGALARVWTLPSPSASGVRPAVAFAPTGDMLAVADGIGTVGVWRLAGAHGGVDPATSAAVALSLVRSLAALAGPPRWRGRATGCTWP